MPDKFETVTLPPLSQGMLTLINSVRSDDRACIDLFNMEYRLQDEPEVRRGMTCWCEEAAAAHPFNKRISSMIYFKNSNTPAQGVLILTTGTKIYRSNTSIEDRLWTDITGSLIIDDDVDWEWSSFFDNDTTAYTDPPTIYNNSILIGCAKQLNQIESGEPSNLAIWTGSGNFQGTHYPLEFRANCLIEMNRRMFYSDWSAKNKLMWTRLGAGLVVTPTPEVTAAGSSFTFLQADIVGFGKTRERLFIFHRNAIQQLKFGEPETDQKLFRIEPLTTSGGAINSGAIVSVLNDVWFLSDMGWVSVIAVEKFGNFEQALIGDKIFDLKSIPRQGADGDLNTPRAIDYYEKNQVWISIPSVQEPEADRRFNKKCYVMDYHPDIFGIAGTDKRFSRYTGRANFTSACIGTYKNRRRLFIASPVQIEAPVPVQLTPTQTGAGNMDFGTYYFVVVAVDYYGNEGLPSNEMSATVSNHATNDRIILHWDPIPNAAYVRIYKGDAPGVYDRYRQTFEGDAALNWDNDNIATGQAIAGSPSATPASTFTIHNVFLTDDKDVLEDDISKFSGTEVSEVINSGFDSKDYSFDNEGMKKEVDLWTALIKMISNTLTLSIGYFFDRDRNKVKTRNFQFEIEEQEEWDEGEWDSASWSAGDDFPEKTISRRFEGFPGRVFKTIRFRVRCFTGERFGWRGLSMDVCGLDEKGVSDK